MCTGSNQCAQVLNCIDVYTTDLYLNDQNSMITLWISCSGSWGIKIPIDVHLFSCRCYYVWGHCKIIGCGSCGHNNSGDVYPFFFIQAPFRVRIILWRVPWAACPNFDKKTTTNLLLKNLKWYWFWNFYSNNIIKTWYSRIYFLMP